MRLRPICVLSQGVHSNRSELRIEPKPRPRTRAQPYPSQLDRMCVDPGAIDGQAPGEFGSIDQLWGHNRASLKQVNDSPRDRLNGSGVEFDATRFHDVHPLCPRNGRFASLNLRFAQAP
jgi:hypothetical protein